MKHIKLFEQFIGEAVNPAAYVKAGKLRYNDQFLGKMSLSKTLSMDLGLSPKHEFGGGDWLGFDHVSLYASGGKKSGTILDDALSGKYTYDELKAAAADFLGISEDFVNEGTWSIGTAEAIKEMIDQLEGMLKLKDCKKILKALDKKFYDRAFTVLGDDSVHDYLAAIERECDGIGNLKAAHAEIENAIERSKVLLKDRLS
jgi:hypothetical protein